jgi:putative endonuclease
MAERAWWLYVLECEGGALYTGITVDVARRVTQHRRGTAAAYTRLRPPLALVGAVKVGTRSDALKLEYAFKQLPASEKWRRATALGIPAMIDPSVDP